MDSEYFIRSALVEAGKAYNLGEVPVGCVVVKDEIIISRGYNLRETGKDAILHAEITAISKACKLLGRWRLDDCDLFVTLEPCPMCAGAIINSRIRRVFFGARDAKAGACGSVLNLFEENFNHKPQIFGGILEHECGGILSDFFRSLRNLSDIT